MKMISSSIAYYTAAQPLLLVYIEEKIEEIKSEVIK